MRQCFDQSKRCALRSARFAAALVGCKDELLD